MIIINGANQGFKAVVHVLKIRDPYIYSRIIISYPLADSFEYFFVYLD